MDTYVDTYQNHDPTIGFVAPFLRAFSKWCLTGPEQVFDYMKYYILSEHYNR